LGNTPAGAGLKGSPWQIAESPQALAFLARQVVPASPARRALIISTFNALLTTGLFGDLDVLQIRAAEDAQSACLNWVANQYNASPIASPAFTADRGFVGDGSNSYVDTGFNPATAVSPKFTQDSASYGLWNLTNQTSSSPQGQFNVTGTTLNVRNASDQVVGRINEATNTTYATGMTDARGLVSINRSGPSSTQGFKSGLLVGSGVGASSPVLNADFTDGWAVTFNTYQFAAVFIGRSLSADKQAALYTILANYMAAVGAA
jgi:hypothetical protein